jgi:multidrug efflux pump subunit AcrB
VASVVPGFTHRAILRYNRKREAVVEADVADGHNLVDVAGRVERAVRAAVSLPPDHEIHSFGQRQEVTESFLSLLEAAVVAVFLIYIILVVRLQSLLQPLLILLAVPMSICGAFWGLAFTGNPISFMAFLGMVSLTGIAVNDSIVLVDTVNRMRGSEGDLPDALVDGATTRLRAVALTSITTVGGLLPLPLSGGEFWAPFGFATIFGLAASTLLALVVQPAANLTLDHWLRRGRPTAGAVASDPARVAEAPERSEALGSAVDGYRSTLLASAPARRAPRSPTSGGRPPAVRARRRRRRRAPSAWRGHRSGRSSTRSRRRGPSPP